MRTQTGMFKIGKLFYLTHVVNYRGAVDKWCEQLFGVTRFWQPTKRRPAATLADRER
jgi:hypothetical protein